MPVLIHPSYAAALMALSVLTVGTPALAEATPSKIAPAALSDAQLLELYAHRACARASHEGDDGELEYLPTDASCSVLGCLPGPLPQAPQAGECGVPTKAEHCPNGLDETHPGRCNGVPGQIPLAGGRRAALRAWVRRIIKLPRGRVS